MKNGIGVGPNSIPGEDQRKFLNWTAIYINLLLYLDCHRKEFCLLCLNATCGKELYIVNGLESRSTKMQI